MQYFRSILTRPEIAILSELSESFFAFQWEIYTSQLSRSYHLFHWMHAKLFHLAHMEWTSMQKTRQLAWVIWPSKSNYLCSTIEKENKFFNFYVHSDENCEGYSTIPIWNSNSAPLIVIRLHRNKTANIGLYSSENASINLKAKNLQLHRVACQCDWGLNFFAVDSSSIKPVNFSTVEMRFLFFLALWLIRLKVHSISSAIVIAYK